MFDAIPGLRNSSAIWAVALCASGAVDAQGQERHGEDGYGAQSRPQDRSIIDGKLYMNWNPDVRRWFLDQSDTLIPATDRYWPELGPRIRDGEPVHWQQVPVGRSRASH